MRAVWRSGQDQRTVSNSPAVSRFILSPDFAHYIFKTTSLDFTSSSDSTSLYQAFLILFFPFRLFSMDKGIWGMLCRKHTHSFAPLLPLPSPVSFTIQSFYIPGLICHFSERTLWAWLRLRIVHNYSMSCHSARYNLYPWHHNSPHGCSPFGVPT